MHAGIKQWFDTALFAENGSFSIRGIGLREVMPVAFIDRPHGTADYLFMRFDDPVQIENGGVLREHGPGTLVIWAPGQPQRYGNRLKGFRHSWIHCKGSWVDGLMERCQLPLDAMIPIPDTAAMEDALTAMHRELTEHLHPNPVLYRNPFECWLHRLARDLNEATADPVPLSLLDLKHQVESEPGHPWTLPEMAKSAGYSRQHFGALFRQYFHEPPMAYLLRTRLRMGAYWLRDHNQSIEEVATRVGFADPFHFSRSFKKAYGLSPRHWRQREGETGASASG